MILLDSIVVSFVDYLGACEDWMKQSGCATLFADECRVRSSSVKTWDAVQGKSLPSHCGRAWVTEIALLMILFKPLPNEEGSFIVNPTSTRV